MRDSGYALALTKQEVIRLILLPAIFPKILSAITLATSVAVGETMIVAIASGQKPNLTLNPFEPIETITSFIIRISLGTVEFDSLIFKTIFTVGFILFLATFLLNTFSYWLQNQQSKSNDNKVKLKTEKSPLNKEKFVEKTYYTNPPKREIINLNTPIALPSLASLHAALHPAPGNELYFVARGDKTHQFSATLEQHNLAVRRYQLHLTTP